MWEDIRVYINRVLALLAENGVYKHMVRCLLDTDVSKATVLRQALPQRTHETFNNFQQSRTYDESQRNPLQHPPCQDASQAWSSYEENLQLLWLYISCFLSISKNLLLLEIMPGNRRDSVWSRCDVIYSQSALPQRGCGIQIWHSILRFSIPAVPFFVSWAGSNWDVRKMKDGYIWPFCVLYSIHDYNTRFTTHILYT